MPIYSNEYQAVSIPNDQNDDDLVPACQEQDSSKNPGG
jgi:hypothetical protein